ncbi:hypothetical protein E4U42_005252 [Claviceps africana]|uniref:Thioesterase domain-containing protein n=1 Tax=Claviceps africana TaxID=83212 RepID=A0A8K0JA27_9HYPO|nr:hypothetical protein E4U42_005252 [Claviceps africana]
MGDASTVVTVEGNGREESVDASLEVSRTVGWFTSMYPLKLPRVSDAVSGVVDAKDGVDGVSNHGIGYGACYGYADDSLPPVSVNYLGRLDEGQQRRPDDWMLSVSESGLSGMLAGLYTAPEDKDASSSVLNMTFAIVSGQLSIRVAGTMGQEELQDLVNTMKSTLRELISRVKIRVQDWRRQGTIRARADDFTPFISLATMTMMAMMSYLHNVVQGLPKRRLVVFNNYYRYRKALSSFEQLVEYYISLMRGVQPQGPYYILGCSFGNSLAMEMAQRLARRGERLGTLALIDAYFDVPGALEEGLGPTGQGEQAGIVDVIYTMYSPSAADRLILFKARHAEESQGSPEQRKLYRWDADSTLNRLDVFVRREAVELVMLDGSHFDWVHRRDEVRRMCALLDECLVGVS